MRICVSLGALLLISDLVVAGRAEGTVVDGPFVDATSVDATSAPDSQEAARQLQDGGSPIYSKAEVDPALGGILTPLVFVLADDYPYQCRCVREASGKLDKQGLGVCYYDQQVICKLLPGGAAPLQVGLGVAAAVLAWLA
eukprot:gnl/TRDRNA2_/TRDRNA2_153365_c2_seq1.p2 gnl/TRDRNA2_/TRDRNA2_153365_c2~~gnl/TRDRNA2_/TRDRNA2_153365_c2_seq1.p2  ORF type:complete len:140 (+),score=20.39 gnl/TRDRNA2_/TRDRNA2_153365_c2_seq1:71-490(+)